MGVLDKIKDAIYGPRIPCELYDTLLIQEHD